MAIGSVPPSRFLAMQSPLDADFIHDVATMAGFVETLCDEHPVAVQRFSAPAFGWPRDCDAPRYFREEATAIEQMARAALAHQGKWRPDDELHKLRQRNALLAQAQQDLASQRGELEDALHKAAHIGDKLLAAMPAWLRQRTSRRQAEIASLRAREAELATEHRQIQAEIAEIECAKRGIKDLEVARARAGRLKDLLERLIVYVGDHALAEQDRERANARQAEARQRAEEEARQQRQLAEERRQTEERHRAQREQNRRDILLDDWHSNTPNQSRTCGGCGNLLAYDGVCIHCSR